MAKLQWNTDNIPSQEGRVIIITGANSGLGAEASKILAKKNATLVLTARSIQKGQKILEDIRQNNKNVQVELLELDLANLASIKVFAKEFQQKYSHLDVLINNAGVMACPFARTQDGFEIQLGTNHLGPFALTGLLMPILKQTKASRVVSTSSIVHNMGNIDFTDFNWERRKYNSGKAYADSKLANLYFTYELAKRLQLEKEPPIVTAAHPGWTLTDLQRHSRIGVFVSKILLSFLVFIS
jgi:NAD(P)-dependent dehydrogenase (short-subunit alcohol dehydrogenase family)